MIGKSRQFIQSQSDINAASPKNFSLHDTALAYCKGLIFNIVKSNSVIYYVKVRLRNVLHSNTSDFKQTRCQCLLLILAALKCKANHTCNDSLRCIGEA